MRKSANTGGNVSDERVLGGGGDGRFLGPPGGERLAGGEPGGLAAHPAGGGVAAGDLLGEQDAEHQGRVSSLSAHETAVSALGQPPLRSQPHLLPAGTISPQSARRHRAELCGTVHSNYSLAYLNCFARSSHAPNFFECCHQVTH
jgi:hypothetical protein